MASQPSTPSGSAPPAVKVTAATYGALDTSTVTNQLWMIRIPPKLASAWEAAAEGTVLGELTFTKGGTAVKPVPGRTTASRPASQPFAASGAVKQSLTVKVSDTFATTDPDLPLEYTIEAMTKKVPTLHPFTRHMDGSVKLHGTVARTANLQTNRTDRYRQYCKNRLVSTVASERFVRPLDMSELSTKAAASRGAGTSQKGFGSSVQQFGKRMLEAKDQSATTAFGSPSALDSAASKKRKFDETQTTRSIIFELFAMKPYWTVKELRQESGGRLEKEIRTVLTEIAEFHRSGEHKNMWELRKEFQKSSEE